MGNHVSSSDFFHLQEKARRATRWLVLWFGLGVAGTAIAIYLIVRVALVSIHGGDREALSYSHELSPTLNLLWDPKLFLGVVLGTLLIIGATSLFKSLELGRSSGADVATTLGGREISLSTTDHAERRLINVVQEMSLASGVPMPKIFVLEKEDSINAFAAGTRTDRAAVAVSQGALTKLSRDELQAVLGHEFSHILNGDMRLNIRLIGWIFGFLAIAILGQIVFRIGILQPRSRSRDEKGGGAILLILGIAFIVVGAISQFFAQIIQAAISRHRERLADASATQFTRNPIALANALSRIGGDANGSKISSPKAGEFAHLFFANGVRSLFSTHPPLEERIRALNPSWDGRFLPPRTRAMINDEDKKEKRAPSFAKTNSNGLHRIFNESSIPVFVSELAQSAPDAKTLIYLLLMTDSPKQNVEQAKMLRARESQNTFKKMELLWPSMKDYPREKRILSVLLMARALQDLSPKERSDFCDTLDALAQIDGNISLFELCILSAVKGSLLSSGEPNLPAAKIIPESELVLNLFLRVAGVPKNRFQEELSAALAQQDLLPKNLRALEDSALTTPALEDAFLKLRTSNIMVRECLISAAKAIISADKKTTDEEFDLINAFAVAINCPLANA